MLLTKTQHNTIASQLRPSIPIVLFCGGKSSRMGEDKALLPFQNAPTLMQYQYERLSKHFHVVISRKINQSIPFDAPVVFENTNAFAPTFGFIAALSSLPHSAIFALSVDTPFVRIDTIKQLMHQHAHAHATITLAATTQHTHMLCGVYSARLLTTFEQMALDKEHALYKMATTQPFQRTLFDDEHEFFNINTPQELLDANR